MLVVAVSLVPVLNIKRSLGFPALVVFLLLHSSHDGTARSGAVVGWLGEPSVSVELEDGGLEGPREGLEEVLEEETHRL